MYLNYSNIKFDSYGRPETPTLLLKTMSDEAVGTIPGVSNLHLGIKFSEPSEMSFDVAAKLENGKPNWIYDRLSGHMIIYTADYGVYVAMNPDKEADGIADTTHITAYSLEKELDSKRFFLDEGTFKFYDITNPNNPDTVIGRILEKAVGWNAGEIEASVAQRYRTFDQYDDYLLPFMYNSATEKYRCVFVFDTYKRTINVYDADSEYECLPIFLDFNNLITNVNVEEMSDELATAIQPYGADQLDIREVNPTGSNWLYNLEYFIAKGDIPKELADKYYAWQLEILANRDHYEGLGAMIASCTAQLLAAQAKLKDLEGELQTSTAKQSVAMAAIANEKNSDLCNQFIKDYGKVPKDQLTEANREIAEWNTKIAEQKKRIEEIEAELDAGKDDSYEAKRTAISDKLEPKAYFGKDYDAISHYLIEKDVVEDSFVATDLDPNVSGISYTIKNGISMTGSKVVRVKIDGPEVEGIPKIEHTMYTIAGGAFAIDAPLTVSDETSSETTTISGDVIRGTMDVFKDNHFVLSIYAGSVLVGSSKSPSAVITIDGTLSNMSTDIKEVYCTVPGSDLFPDEIPDDKKVISYEGTKLVFNSPDASLYLTANISDYKRYSVQRELYDYAQEVLNDIAFPTYEFSVDSGNFIFGKKFAPFRESLELGKGVYLNIGGSQPIKPYIIEFELDFEDYSKFSIVFSNRFKRHDVVGTLKGIIEKSYSSSRSLDASKYLYNQVANQATQVSKFMSDSLNAAVNKVLAAANQSVMIDGAGIHVTSSQDPNSQLRITNGMIALTDDNWATSNLAIGLFTDENGRKHTGVNVDVLAGKAVIGNNLWIENPKVDENGAPTGIMQFKVDSTGAWLNNSTFVLQDDTEGSIGQLLIHPRYGLAAGYISYGDADADGNKPVLGNLFATNGTSVVPSFIDDDGKLVLEDGFPKNANFYIDSRTGDVYLRGKVVATSGEFTGKVTAQDFYFKDGDNVRTLINKKGEVDFSDMTRIDLGGIVIDGENNTIEFTGGVGSISWGNVAPVKYEFSATGADGTWHTTMQSTDWYRHDSLDGGKTWSAAYQFRGRNGANGSDGDPRGYLQSIQVTEITQDSVKSAHIQGARIEGAEIWGGTITSGSTIDVTTDVTIGNNLYIGSTRSNGKAIIFGDFASISNPLGTEALEIGAWGNIIFSTNGTLDLSGVGNIVWPDGEPKARFG